MTTQYNLNDPFEAAIAAAEAPDTRFGQAHVEARFVGLVKGQGKADYDAQVHKQRYTEITIRVDPLENSGRTFFDRREMLGEFGDFSKIVWPSLRRLGCQSARDLHGRWCKYELVETGTYTNKNGEARTSTTFKFCEFYADEAACAAAYRQYLDERFTVTGAEDNGAAAVDMSPRAGAGAQESAERETARLFLGALVKQYAGNRAGLAQAIAGMPIISKYFTVDSPEAQLAA